VLEEGRLSDIEDEEFGNDVMHAVSGFYARLLNLCQNGVLGLSMG
jgi:hypothetical protein